MSLFKNTCFQKLTFLTINKVRLEMKCGFNSIIIRHANPKCECGLEITCLAQPMGDRDRCVPLHSTHQHRKPCTSLQCGKGVSWLPSDLSDITTLPSNKWTFSLWTYHTNKRKHSYMLLLSQRLNCRSFDRQNGLQSPSKHCRNLHDHNNQSSIPSDVLNLKSFITLHVFPRT